MDKTCLQSQKKIKGKKEVNHRLGSCALTYKHESYAGTHQSNLFRSKMTNRRVLENSDKKGKTEKQKKPVVAIAEPPLLQLFRFIWCLF